MSIDTGGPAYPVQNAGTAGTVCGMTLLDAFAIAAMPEILRELISDESWEDDTTCTYEIVAARAYAQARAMLAEKRRLEGAE